MSMALQMALEGGVLDATVTGQFSLEEAKCLFRRILEVAAQKKAGRVLIDGRGIRGRPEVFERFYFHTFAAQVMNDYVLRGCFRPPPRIAYVLKEPVRDPQGMGELVATNRGMLVKVYAHLGQAREWLGMQPAQMAAPAEAKSRHWC